MKSVLLHILGLKGINVLVSLADSPHVVILHCVIGCDTGVDNDYSSEAATFCAARGIPHSFRSEENSFILPKNYDFVVASGWRWMIRNAEYQKLIVFHDSILPRYRGFLPLVNSLLNKEKYIGVTALLGSENYDMGNILLQVTASVQYPTNILNETVKIANLYSELSSTLFRKISEGSIDLRGEVQNEEEATYSLWRDVEDYRINWNDSADNIEHFISCVGTPYSGASALLEGATVKILAASVAADVAIENRHVGKVLFVEFGFPVVVCGSGLLVIKKIVDENGQSLLPLKRFRSKFK